MKPRVLKGIPETRIALAGAAALGLVPTMGALHDGHGRLIEVARRESAVVVTSIFVNPTQFNQASDYEQYPRDLAADVEFCAARGVDFVFAPEAAEMYPEPPLTTVEVAQIGDGLCGRHRPGHFRGVATVVTKLFQIIQPERAYFGEKDAQQLALIRRMTADLNMPVEIVPVPTVRDADGLALSSRNRRLNPRERAAAPALNRALSAAAALVTAGETDPDKVKAVALEMLAREPLIRVEYLELVDPERMQAVERISGPVRAAAAMWLGETRLIDNVFCSPSK